MLIELAEREVGAWRILISQMEAEVKLLDSIERKLRPAQPELAPLSTSDVEIVVSPDLNARMEGVLAQARQVDGPSQISAGEVVRPRKSGNACRPRKAVSAAPNPEKICNKKTKAKPVLEPPSILVTRQEKSLLPVEILIPKQKINVPAVAVQPHGHKLDFLTRRLEALLFCHKLQHSDRIKQVFELSLSVDALLRGKMTVKNDGEVRELMQKDNLLSMLAKHHDLLRMAARALEYPELLQKKLSTSPKATAFLNQLSSSLAYLYADMKSVKSVEESAESESMYDEFVRISYQCKEAAHCVSTKEQLEAICAKLKLICLIAHRKTLVLLFR